MVHGKPLTVIFSFALPLLVGNLFNQLYNVVDTAIVGRALGADALAAVGSTGNINACLFLLLGGLATGVSVIVSQYWGAKNTMSCAGCWAHSRPCCWRGLLCWLRWVRH